MSSAETRPPLAPFTRESATLKVRLAEDGWNSRDPAKVALAYTPDTQWRNRAEFVTSRAGGAGVSRAQMAQRTGVPLDQGAVGLYR